MFKKIFSYITLSIIITQGFGQFQIPERTELYRDDVVSRMDVFIPEEDLAFILSPENSNSNELFAADLIFDNGTVRDTLVDIGFRLRGNTSRNADKKSFKIDLNAFVSGRNYYGVQKINLNGQHNDPTVARAKISADIADLLNIPSLRTSHTQLYINGDYFGLYANVEHVDQNYCDIRFNNQNGNLYKCLYPADLRYQGSNPEAYKENVFGRRKYELKTNNEADDYSDFASFVDILNNTSPSEFRCQLESVFNVDQYLRTIVFDILIGNWDGPIYNQNNFYLYHNDDTGLFEYIPYDLDNTLGIDWVNRDWGNRNIYSWSQGSNQRPLYDKIISNGEYRNRFSFYMNEAIESFYSSGMMYQYLENLRNLLRPSIQNDPYYPQDYGFDESDFAQGFDGALPFQQTDYGIRSFIEARRNSALDQLSLSNISPIITEINYNHPNHDQVLVVSAKVIDDGDLNYVQLCYQINETTEECATMRDDGLDSDLIAEDNIYTAEVEGFSEDDNLKFRIKSADTQSKISFSPQCNKVEILIEPSISSLVINEFMAKNTSIISDQKNEYEDWIELYNSSSQPIYLGDKYLSDNPDKEDKWRLPLQTLDPNDYIVLWADDDEKQGLLHTNFKLKAGGEDIVLSEINREEITIIDQHQYETQSDDVSEGRLPNGTGPFLRLVPSYGEENTNLTSISDLDLKIMVSPNPTSDELLIENFNSFTEPTSFKIIGMDGKIEMSGNLSEQINVSRLSSGLKCIIISGKDQKLSTTFVKI